jgi:cytochrome c-type biogenesis protein CcmF
MAGDALGLVASLCAVMTIAVGLLRKRPDLVQLGRVYTWIVLAAAVLGVASMEHALLTHDFTVRFVAENGSTATPLLFTVAGLWSALEGSILLWVLFLSGYTFAVGQKFRRRLDDPLVGWALLTMFVVCTFFFALLMGPANPFRAFSPAPGFNGPGPNPLLQDNTLVAIHPPMLYLGFVGFTVPFAFAIAALVTGRVGEGWLLETRRWTLVAWGFLSVGIVLGAWWSYQVLGWGGYWAWDPVENASFLPWITGTAYLHSVMVQERRGMLRVWNLSLLCATFSLTILGTFLTRSGVIQSVHAFSQSSLGPALLGFFALVVAVTIGLIAWRGDRLRSPGRIDSPISREGAFLANNVLFAAFAFVVLLGTVFPLAAEAISNSQISVGAPYFNRMTLPIVIALLFLMAVAPVLPWRKANAELLRHRLLWPAWIGTFSVVLGVVLGQRGFAPLVAYGLAGFAAGSAARQLVLATRRQGWRGLVGRANGGMVVHIGVVLIAVAFAASASNVRTAELQLSHPGQVAHFDGHTIEYVRLSIRPEASKIQTSAVVKVDGHGPFGPGIAAFRQQDGTTNPIGTPSVYSSPFGDVAMALLATPTGSSQAVTIRVTVQPLIVWLWIGGGVIALGTALAAFPGRRRRPTQPVSAPVPERRPRRPQPAPSERDHEPDATPEPANVRVETA